MNDCEGPLHPAAVEGIELFNRREYFEAHEALETAWRAEQGPIRELYRGILQIAVAYLHITRSNYQGAIKVYGRSQKWLRVWPETCRGIDVGGLQRDAARALAEVQRLGPHGLSAFDPALFTPIHYDHN
jgi:predicted metal-dependent hydrolase